MKIPKISLGFSKYSDANLLTKAQLIFSKMTGNASLPDPVPALTLLDDAINDYDAALTNALKGGKDNVAKKNAARVALILVLQELGRWVMFTANGNVTILISSGYDLTKLPEPRHLQAPGNVTVSNGLSSGTLVTSIPRVPGANGYMHQITGILPTPDTVWESVATSRSRWVHSNLVPGKQYWLRVAATGSNGQIEYSAVASKFAQ